jgi:hypothetical protein
VNHDALAAFDGAALQRPDTPVRDLDVAPRLDGAVPRPESLRLFTVLTGLLLGARRMMLGHLAPAGPEWAWMPILLDFRHV